MKFSIITPVYLANFERVQQFLRCIESVKNQTFKDFEWVIIDDGSVEQVNWEEILKGIRIVLIHKENENRIVAYYDAMQVANGDWFTFLDSDDELPPEALEIWNKAIEGPIKHKMYNCGAIYHHKDGTITKREPFKPKWMGRKYGHEQFGGGNIVNGTFIFHRSVYEKLGGFPPKVIENVDCTSINYPMGGEMVRPLYMTTPFDFSAAAQIEFPEIRKYFMVDHENEPRWKIIKELGNSWGQDYYLFYKYTRVYNSKPIEEYLYIVHPK